MKPFEVIEDALRRKGIEPPWTVTEPTYVLAHEILMSLSDAGYDVVQRPGPMDWLWQQEDDEERQPGG